MAAGPSVLATLRVRGMARGVFYPALLTSLPAVERIEREFAGGQEWDPLGDF